MAVRRTNWYVITGAPCSGKTSVINAFEQQGFLVVHEVARAYIDEELQQGKSLKQIKADVNWSLWWPPVILENLVVNSFYFMAGLVLLEKREGTLEAQIVTPLKTGEYLLSKAISLGLLSVLESFLIILVISGTGFNWIEHGTRATQL